MPMGMADIATVLYKNHLKFDPSDPNWIDRDRLIISNGHGSMLLYSCLYLTGYKEIDINQIIEKNKAIISIFPGSRISEIEILMPILLDFIKLMNEKYDDFLFVFHSTETMRLMVEKYLKKIKILTLYLLVNLAKLFQYWNQKIVKKFYLLEK